MENLQQFPRLPSLNCIADTKKRPTYSQPAIGGSIEKTLAKRGEHMAYVPFQRLWATLTLPFEGLLELFMHSLHPVKPVAVETCLKRGWDQARNPGVRRPSLHFHVICRLPHLQQTYLVLPLPTYPYPIRTYWGPYRRHSSLIALHYIAYAMYSTGRVGYHLLRFDIVSLCQITWGLEGLART